MDGGAWWATVHGIAKSWTRLSDFTFPFPFYALEKEMATTPVFLPGESQGQGNLVGGRLWGHTESDTTEACLENPMDGGAWWATVHGVANSWT